MELYQACLRTTRGLVEIILNDMGHEIVTVCPGISFLWRCCHVILVCLSLFHFFGHE
jgi:hypothetical protein